MTTFRQLATNVGTNTANSQTSILATYYSCDSSSSKDDVISMAIHSFACTQQAVSAGCFCSSHLQLWCCQCWYHLHSAEVSSIGQRLALDSSSAGIHPAGVHSAIPFVCCPPAWQAIMSLGRMPTGVLVPGPGYGLQLSMIHRQPLPHGPQTPVSSFPCLPLMTW